MGKKGRPIELEAFTETLKELQKRYPEITTKRGLYNKFYEEIGYELLYNFETKTLNDPAYSFIISDRKVKRTIISELGRIAYRYSEEDAIYLAEKICEFQMSTKQAINYLRQIKGFQKNKIEGIVRQVLTLVKNNYLTTDEIKVFQKQLRDQLFKKQ